MADLELSLSGTATTVINLQLQMGFAEVKGIHVHLMLTPFTQLIGAHVAIGNEGGYAIVELKRWPHLAVDFLTNYHKRC